MKCSPSHSTMIDVAMFTTRLQLQSSASSSEHHRSRTANPAMLQCPHKQNGVTLIELMVGIAIGLLTVAVATGALMVSRGVSGTVSDASQLQQQASYAFRVIGQQVRQSGSIRLNMSSSTAASGTADPADPVAFEVKYINPGNATDTFAPKTDTISGQDSPILLTTGFRNYKESLYTAGGDDSQFRNCLGQQGTDALVMSTFSLSGDALMCANSAPASAPQTPQPIIQNVADFQVLYLAQTAGNTGIPKMQYINAATAAADWTQVFGVEVCLVIYGTERIEVPNGTQYKGCDGSNIDFSPTGTLSTSRKNRLHMTFRKVYQIRSQGIANVTG